MLDESLQTKMLTAIYSVFFDNGGNATVVDSMTDDFGVDRNTIYQNAQVLTENHLAEFITMGTIQPTSYGILSIEEQGLVSDDQINRNKAARTKILNALAKVREEHGVHGWAAYQWVMQEADVEDKLFDSNQEFLRGLGMLDWPAMQMMAITPQGMNAVKEWRKRVAVAERYQHLKSGTAVSPQRRGHELEALLKAVIEKEGWASEANVRAPGEENDLIIHLAREYYVIQCKWEEHPVQPHYLGVLRDRVTSRAGIRGLFVSNSNFTPEAVKDAIDRLEAAMILLFGPGDVEQIMTGKESFSALLDSKFHAAVTRKEMIVDNIPHKR